MVSKKRRNKMNIAQIKQLQAVDGWVDFTAQVIEVKELKVRTKKNRMMQKVKLKDETDEIGAWLYADLQQVAPNQYITANGMLKEYKDIRYIDYATVKTAQPGPQNAQQGASQSTGQPNGKEEVDWDAIAEGKVRHGILCAYLQGGVEPNYDTVLKHTNFVMHGKNYQLAQEADKLADDIPF